MFNSTTKGRCIRFAHRALAALLLCVPPAHAINDEIQVYTGDIYEPGQFGLELHMNTTPAGRSTPDYPGDSIPRHGFRLTPEFSYGINKDFEAGMYLPTVRDADGSDAAAVAAEVGSLVAKHPAYPRG